MTQQITTHLGCHHSQKIIFMCIQHFQKTGKTDGFLLNTLGINDGRLLYASKYLCSLLFLVLLEWLHPTTYGHYLWPEFHCRCKLQWCGKETDLTVDVPGYLINPTFFTLLYELRRETPLVQWVLRTCFSMINITTVLNSWCLGCSWSYKLTLQTA